MEPIIRGSVDGPADRVSHGKMPLEVTYPSTNRTFTMSKAYNLSSFTYMLSFAIRKDLSS